MAVRYDTRYPGQVDAAIAGYPYGRARNVDTPGSGDGTPWERDLVNDIFGLQQALLTEAEIVPSGVPDSAALSQYLAAIRKLTRRVACEVVLTTPAPLADDDFFTLAIADQSIDAGFTTVLDGGTIPALVVPEPGWYLFFVRMAIATTNTDLPALAEVRIMTNANSEFIRGRRWSANPGHSFELVGHVLMQTVTGEDMDRVYVQLKAGETAQLDPGFPARLSVVKITGGKASTGW